MKAIRPSSEVRRAEFADNQRDLLEASKGEWEPSELTSVRELANELHSGTSYGDGLTMFNQVALTAYLVYTVTEDIGLTKAAFLHKAWEPSKVKGKTAILSEQLAEIVSSERGAAVISQLAQESSGEDKRPWIETFSDDTKIVFLAEKTANFIVSGVAPNPGKATDWHMKYVESRGKEANLCLSEAPLVNAMKSLSSEHLLLSQGKLERRTEQAQSIR